MANLAGTSRLLTAMVLLMLCGACSRSVEAQCPVPVWADEFEGNQLDLGKWTPQIGDGCDMGICGWGNNELQYYQAENAVVEDGRLKIIARRQSVGGKAFTSARLRTINKGDFRFGRIEARLKLPSGQGMWPAFWMLSTDEVFGGWPRSGEIDIMEARGIATDVFLGTLHFGEAFPNNRSSGADFLARGMDLSADFHVYAIEWEEDEIRWYFDDVLYARRTPEDLRGRNWPFNERFHLLLNLAVGGTFVGPVDEDVLPRQMEVDYVRVYDASFPAMTGPRRVDRGTRGVRYSVVANGGGASVSSKGRGRVATQSSRRAATDDTSDSASGLPGNDASGEAAAANAAAGSVAAVAGALSGTGFSYRWSVPVGARILSGQGTDSIAVDWGGQGGQVTAQRLTGGAASPRQDACNSGGLSMTVQVDAQRQAERVLDNGEDQRLPVLFRTGQLTEQAANPDARPPNESARATLYQRNASEKFDVIVYGLPGGVDGGRMASGELRFSMDVWTDAEPGTSVLLQLENDSISSGINFPRGRHSTYTARTVRQGEWQGLDFEFSARLDGDTPDEPLDILALLVDGGWDTSDTYYFDNLVITSQIPCQAESFSVVSFQADPEEARSEAVQPGTLRAGVVDNCGKAVSDAGLTVRVATGNQELRAQSGDSGFAFFNLAAAPRPGRFLACIVEASHPVLTLSRPLDAGDCLGSPRRRPTVGK